MSRIDDHEYLQQLIDRRDGCIRAIEALEAMLGDGSGRGDSGVSVAKKKRGRRSKAQIEADERAKKSAEEAIEKDF